MSQLIASSLFAAMILDFEQEALQHDVPSHGDVESLDYHGRAQIALLSRTEQPCTHRPIIPQERTGVKHLAVA